MRNTLYNHNSRSYYDIYNALVQAYPNKPVWMFEEMSALFDFKSELMNRVATDIIEPVTRESAYGSYAGRCGYTPVEADGCTATVTITLTSAMVKTLSAGYQVGGISSATGDLVIFELTADASSGGTDTISASVKQKQTFSSINVGTIDNQEDWMDYPIDGYTKILKTSASLIINSLAWTRVDNFDDSTSTDRHFKLLYQSNGKSRIQFGNGTTGLKPTLNQVIYATFEVTKGLLGVMAADEININVGGDSAISSLTNASATSGGNDAESVASIIRNSAANVRLRNITWSEEDIETAALASSSSVVKAFGVGGIGDCSVYIVPSGGGTPSGALLTTVQDYVKSLSQFGLLPCTAYAPTYITTDITATATVRSGFVSATVLDLVEFALTLVATSIDSQVIDSYNDYGIDTCRTSVINTVWSWAFTSDENEALEFIILKWKSLLGTRTYREFGQDLEMGDLWQIANDLYDYGVDIFSLTSPTENVVIALTEISEAGSVSVT